MLSIREAFGAFSGRLRSIGTIAQLAGRSQSASPAASTPVSRWADDAEPGEMSSSSIAFVFDSTTEGTESRLTGFDGVRQLFFTTSRGAFTAVFDSNTVFKNAHLDTLEPVDPCHDMAAVYNEAGAASDLGGVLSAIGAMATVGGLARILTEQSHSSTMTIKSFRPLATF